MPTRRRPPPRRGTRRRRNAARRRGETIAAIILVVAVLAGYQAWGPGLDLGSDAPDAPAAGPAPGVPPAPPTDATSIVDAAGAVAAPYGTYVCSAYRPGAHVQSGGRSDHSSNDADRAARDIAVRGVNCLWGPPPAALDEAAVAIGKYFGRTYALGAVVDSDRFAWHGYRIEIIWRTPKYGGHLGHIHIGACRACPV